VSYTAFPFRKLEESARERFIYHAKVIWLLISSEEFISTAPHVDWLYGKRCNTEGIGKAFANECYLLIFYTYFYLETHISCITMGLSTLCSPSQPICKVSTTQEQLEHTLGKWKLS